MPRLTIQGNTYDYPDPGQDPGWGEEATAWAEAVTAALNTLIGLGDILETSFTLQDNISSPSNVEGLRFDPAFVRAANVSYSVIRNGINQSGTLHISYNSSGAIGEKFTLQDTGSGNVGIAFSILDSGQVQYRSASTGSTSQIKFSAKTLSQ